MQSNAFLVSVSPVVMERVLRVALGGIVATVTGVALMGCSNTCQAPACGCGNTNFTPQSYDVMFTVCSTSDASVEASSDGGTADAGVCFVSCSEACSTLKPVSDPGTGTCVSSTDAGAGGTVTAGCQTEMLCIGGRKLDGLLPPVSGVSGGSYAAMLAEMAWLEAASVHAFHRLARELEAHGAPRALVRRAKASARDEVRHARIMSKLAKKHGARVPRVVVRDLPVRSLEGIARENAVEGCVGETFGALVAAWHGAHAKDADFAAAMRQIAPDELRHAALGWAVAAWANARLSEEERARVRAARDAAARELMTAVRTPDEALLADALVGRVLQAA